jgi:hypothetical protein
MATDVLGTYEEIPSLGANLPISLICSLIFVGGNGHKIKFSKEKRGR